MIRTSADYTLDKRERTSLGLEDLVGKRYLKDQKCPACMIGKSTLENYPGLKEPVTRPLAVVHMDFNSSSIPPIEGYNHSLILTDSYSDYQWKYVMKTKNETMSMVKRWMADSGRDCGREKRPSSTDGG